MTPHKHTTVKKYIVNPLKTLLFTGCRETAKPKPYINTME